MFEGFAGAARDAAITLVTDAFTVHGTIHTRQRRITDMLNTAEHEFLVIENATFEEFGAAGVAIQADFAQVNLGTVLFGVANEPVEALPELRVSKVQERALISVPPFTITGRIHLMAGRDLRQALDELTGRFLPVTEVLYWSDRLGEARTTVQMVAVNHSRAQILAPYREVDPWAGLDRSGAAAPAGRGPAAPAAGGGSAAPRQPDPAWPEVDRPG